MPDGRHVVLSKDRARNIANFDALARGDGSTFDAEMQRFGGDASFVFACWAAHCGRVPRRS